MTRRPLIAVAGDGRVSAGDPHYEAARLLGRCLVDRGYRVLTGGGGGVSEAASRGAHESASWTHGDVVGVLPGRDTTTANPWVDTAVATGLSHLRNGLVASGDAVIGVGGGAGTLSELALAWVFDRLVITLRGGGWAARLADAPVDERVRFPHIPGDRVYGANTPDEAAVLLDRLLPLYLPWASSTREV